VLRDNILVRSMAIRGANRARARADQDVVDITSQVVNFDHGTLLGLRPEGGLCARATLAGLLADQLLRKTGNVGVGDRSSRLRASCTLVSSGKRVDDEAFLAPEVHLLELLG